MAETLAVFIPIVFILSVAGVLILRPLTKRLGTLLEAYAQDRVASRTEDRQLDSMRDRFESLDRRLDVLEERMGFTEELVGRRPAERVQPPEEGARSSTTAARLAGHG